MSINKKEQEHINKIKSSLGYGEFIVMLSSLMAINALAIDIMLPAMRDIANEMHVFVENDQHYIIFSYILGFGISQLIFGPLSDRFGRRIPLIIGLICYSIAAILCIFASNFKIFLFLRAIQGMGAATTRVLIVSIVRDLYSGRDMAKVMSIAMMVFMMIPVIAPATGQALMLLSSWEIIFAFMAVIGVLLVIWVYFRLPETLYEKRPFTLKAISQSFKTVCSNRIALNYTLAFSVLMGALFGALNTAEQVYNGIYGLGKLFPLAFAAVAIAQAVSSFLNARFVGQLGMHRISHAMLILFCISSFIWFMWTYFNNAQIPFIPYMILFACAMFCFGSIGANFNSLAMEPLGQVAGTASAVFGFLQTVIGAVIGLFIAQHFNGTTLPLAFGFFVLGLLTLGFVLIAEKGKLFKATHDHNS